MKTYSFTRLHPDLCGSIHTPTALSTGMPKAGTRCLRDAKGRAKSRGYAFDIPIPVAPAASLFHDYIHVFKKATNLNKVSELRVQLYAAESFVRSWSSLSLTRNFSLHSAIFCDRRKCNKEENTELRRSILPLSSCFVVIRYDRQEQLRKEQISGEHNVSIFTLRCSWLCQSVLRSFISFSSLSYDRSKASSKSSSPHSEI